MRPLESPTIFLMCSVFGSVPFRQCDMVDLSIPRSRAKRIVPYSLTQSINVLFVFCDFAALSDDFTAPSPVVIFKSDIPVLVVLCVNLIHRYCTIDKLYE